MVALALIVIFVVLGRIGLWFKDHPGGDLDRDARIYMSIKYQWPVTENGWLPHSGILERNKIALSELRELENSGKSMSKYFAS